MRYNENMSSRTSGFTLLEVILVIAIIALIIVSYPLTFNLKNQVGKGQDTQRKNDLTRLKSSLEDFYNDNERYPTPDEICFDSNGQTTCNICGKVETPAEFAEYLPVLPCDPEYASKTYLYHVDNVTHPSWYRIYTKLSNAADPASAASGCTHGCGLGPFYDYSWGVSSPNIDLERNTQYCSSYTNLYVLQGGLCNNCGNLANCENLYGNTTTYYTDPGGAGQQGCVIDCVH